MLDIAPIQTPAKTTRPETKAPEAQGDQPSENRDDDFETVLAAQSGDDAGNEEKTEQAYESPTDEETVTVKPAEIADTPEPDQALNKKMSDQSDPKPGDGNPIVQRPETSEAKLPETPAKRGKTASEFAILQQAGRADTKPQSAYTRAARPPASDETVPAATARSASMPSADNVRTEPTVPASPGDTVQSLPKRGDPIPQKNAPALQNAPAAEADARPLSTPAVPTSAADRPPAVPVSQALPAAGKSDKRAERIAVTEKETRDLPAAATPRTENRSPRLAVAVQKAAQGPLDVRKAGQGEKPDLMPLTDLDTDTATQWDARTAGTSTVQQAVSRAETPSIIGRQMAEALHRLPDRPVEIALSPKELGRVRMSISAVDGSITVSVLAERPETLDLMRRNIDQLAREFQAIGFETISFSFSEGQQQTNENADENGSFLADANVAEEGIPTEVTDQPVELMASTGLDLRL